VHQKWARAAEDEKVSRTRFAQHAIKPDEVDRELKETDAVLADPATARRFLENAAQRLNLRLRPAAGDTLVVSGFDRLPDLARAAAPVLFPSSISPSTRSGLLPSCGGGSQAMKQNS